MHTGTHAAKPRARKRVGATAQRFSCDPSSAQGWRQAPSAAFAAWLDDVKVAPNRSLRPSSRIVYQGMFEALLEYLRGQGHDLSALDTSTIEGFLQARGVDTHRRHRYLLLFSRLMGHLQVEGLLPAKANPARDLLLKDPRPEDPAARVLGPLEVQRLLAALDHVGRGGWRRLRLRAQVEVLLGCGLRSAELLALRLEQLGQSSLEVLPRLPRPGRTVPIPEPAQAAIKAWLAVRLAWPDTTRLVFPSNPQGGAIAASSLFRQIRGCLQEAGVAVDLEGPALLRNTCAARMLATQPIAKVCQWMGFEDTRSALRFTEASKAWEVWL